MSVIVYRYPDNLTNDIFKVLQVTDVETAMMYLNSSYIYEIDTVFILDKSYYDELTNYLFVSDKINRRDFYEIPLEVGEYENFCLMLEKKFNAVRFRT